MVSLLEFLLSLVGCGSIADRQVLTLTAGGHSFGKRTATAMRRRLGLAPAGDDLRAQSFGWASSAQQGCIDRVINAVYCCSMRKMRQR